MKGWKLFVAVAFNTLVLTVIVFAQSDDLAGTVRGLQGRPLSTAQPKAGQALIWNGSAWAPTDVGTSSFAPGSTVEGPLYFLPSSTDSTADIVSAWKHGSTPTAHCMGSQDCLFAVLASGSLFFAGSNAEYKGHEAAYVRLYAGGNPTAPAYIEGLDASGTAHTVLAFSTTESGVACLHGAIITGDCPAGSRIMTEADVTELVRRELRRSQGK